MDRRSFLVIAATALALPAAPRAAFARSRARSVAVVRRDRAWLVGNAGGCASRRRAHPAAGFTLAELA